TSSRSSMNTSRTSSTSPATGRPPTRSCSRTSWATPKFLSKEALTELIAATGGHIRLIVFNTCFSRNQVEAVVQHVKAVIGVGTSMGNDAARFFAAAFYGAIGFGHSVEQAFKQGLAQLAVEGIPDEPAARAVHPAEA